MQNQIINPLGKKGEYRAKYENHGNGSVDLMANLVQLWRVAQTINSDTNLGAPTRRFYVWGFSLCF
jgi:hypothetical protein